MKRIMILSDYPSLENPADYTFIQSRVNVLRNCYEIVVISVRFVKHDTNDFDIVHEKGQKVIWINIKRSNIRVISRFIHDSKVKRILDKIITEVKPDLIHVHFSDYYSWIINKFAKEKGIPYFITEHATNFEKNLKHYFLGKKILKALNNAEEIISVSYPLKEKIMKYVKRDVKVIPNFVDTDRFYFVKNDQKEATDIQMITIGTLDRNDKKGYEILIKTLYLLKQENYRFYINIIGEGANRGKLETMVKELNLNNEVRFLGVVENHLLVDYFAKADLFVSSSRKETFGVAIIEAMSCGLPVLATASGGPEDYMNERLGILVDNESIDSLLAGMIEMIDNYAIYNFKDIREFIMANYSKESYLGIKEALYNKYL